MTVPIEAEGSTIGLIGVGRQGRRHLKEMLEVGLSVEAVDSNLDPTLVEGLEESQGNLTVLAQNAIDYLAETDTKAVVIATPGNTHFELAKEALGAGKHILLEKPFTPTSREAQELVTMAEERGLILMAGHNRAYLPHFRQLVEQARNGRLGKIIEIEASYLNPPQNSDFSHTALEGLGYHLFYMLHDILGVDEPTVLVQAARSEDWEVVGLKLMYGNVPVILKMDRRHEGDKTRNIVVRGEDFTATFDYSGEPVSTKLAVKRNPTSRLIKASQQYEPLEPVRLSSEESKPSLHHQLMAFLASIETGTPPPSSGKNAISIVRVLENIRSCLILPRFYDPKLGGNHIADLADTIRDYMGQKGGIVTIDGQSGTGKSTLARQLGDYWQLRYPPALGAVLSLDESMKFWEECGALKRRILDEALEGDQAILDRNGWVDASPGQPYTKEHFMWRHDEIDWYLKRVRDFFASSGIYHPDTAVTLTQESARIKQGINQLMGQSCARVRLRDLLLVEGKYANTHLYGDSSDIRVRVETDSETARKQFEENRASFLGAQALRGHMRYYDLVIVPSWDEYAKGTADKIDIFVDPVAGQIRLPQIAS